MKKLIHLFLFSYPAFCVAQHQVILDRTTHLRDGITREWSSFPLHAKDSQLVIHFKTSNVSNPKTLGLTQTDVNHPWKVILNGNTIGNLVADEKKMVSYYSVLPQALNENDNTLTIRSEAANAAQPDDIAIGQITLHDKAIANLLAESSLNIHSGIPSRLTILNEANALQPLTVETGDTLAARAGVLYSATGNFSCSLPAGKYMIYASRGFEYGVDSIEVILKPGKKFSGNLTLKHEVDLKDWVSVDTHVHTLEYSGHGDAAMRERILTIAGEGLDYAVITEHNKVVDIIDEVKKLNLDSWFTPVAGDELTTGIGHFNLFPIASPPSPDIKNWQQLKKTIAINKEIRAIILNHARDEHNGVRPFDTLQHLNIEQLPINAMEVMNSGSQQTNPRQLYLDWLGLIRRGVVLTPVGSSDSHDVNRFIVGQARTYVRKGNIVENFVAGKVGVSFGLFTELIFDSTSKNVATVRIYSPSWITPNRLRLFANGKEIYSSTVSKRDKTGNNVFSRKINMPNISNDTILVAVAEGNDPHAPWWPIAKPYQHASPEVNPIVLGLTGPVRTCR